MIDSRTNKIIGGVLLAGAWFLATAIVDAWITVWVFKRHGGCPMYKHDKIKQPKEV